MAKEYPGYERRRHPAREYSRERFIREDEIPVNLRNYAQMDEIAQAPSGGAYGNEWGYMRIHPGWRRHGYQERGNYTGRGPAGYRRSDEGIYDEVNQRLTAHPDLDATRINVHVVEGVVTLDGRVETRDDKRLAEDVTLLVRGVADVINKLAFDRRC